MPRNILNEPKSKITSNILIPNINRERTDTITNKAIVTYPSIPKRFSNVLYQLFINGTLPKGNDIILLVLVVLIMIFMYLFFSNLSKEIY